MTGLKLFILSLVFLSELTALAALGYWGFHVPKGMPLKLVLGIGTPLVVAVIWGLFLAPRAVFPVDLPIKMLLKLMVFAISAWALHAAGHAQVALYFFIAALLLLFITEPFKMSIE